MADTIETRVLDKIADALVEYADQGILISTITITLNGHDGDANVTVQGAKDGDFEESFTVNAHGEPRRTVLPQLREIITDQELP